MNAEKKIRNKQARKESKMLACIEERLPIIVDYRYNLIIDLSVPSGKYHPTDAEYKPIIAELKKEKTFHENVISPFLIVEQTPEGKSRVTCSLKNDTYLADILA